MHDQREAIAHGIVQAAFGTRALIGAGTVLDVAAVDRLAATGARLMVTPNTDAAVIARGMGHGLEVMPGFLTPSEAFTALRAGARRLKLFPASAQGIDASVVGVVEGDGLTLPGGQTISVAELRDAHEGWLPAYMASLPAAA